LSDDPNKHAAVEPGFEEFRLYIGQFHEQAVAADSVPFDLENVYGQAVFAQELGVNGRCVFELD